MDDETCEIVVDGVRCDKQSVTACARCDRELCSAHSEEVIRDSGLVVVVCAECKVKPGEWRVLI